MFPHLIENSMNRSGLNVGIKINKFEANKAIIKLVLSETKQKGDKAMSLSMLDWSKLHWL